MTKTHSITKTPSEKKKYDKTRYPLKDKRLTCPTCGQKYYSGKWFVTHTRWHEANPGKIWVPANGHVKKSKGENVLTTCETVPPFVRVLPDPKDSKPTVVGNLADTKLSTAPPCVTTDSSALMTEPGISLGDVSHMEEDRSAMAKKDSCRMQNLCISCNKQFAIGYKMKYCPDCGATLKTISYVKVVLK